MKAEEFLQNSWLPDKFIHGKYESNTWDEFYPDIAEIMEEYASQSAQERYERAYASLGKDTFYLDYGDGVDLGIIDKALRIAAFGKIDK